MYSSTPNNQLSSQDVFQFAEFFSHRLDAFLAPLFIQRDKLLGKRLYMLMPEGGR